MSDVDDDIYSSKVQDYIMFFTLIYVTAGGQSFKLSCIQYIQVYILNRFALKINLFSHNLFNCTTCTRYHTTIIFPERMVLPALVRQLSSRSWQSRISVLNTYRCLHASPYNLAQSPTVLKGTCCLGARYTFGC